jgi:hypothetical protein
LPKTRAATFTGDLGLDLVRGGVQESFFHALKELRRFSAAQADKTTNDRACAPDSEFPLSPAPRTDKNDKKSQGWPDSWDAEIWMEILPAVEVARKEG